MAKTPNEIIVNITTHPVLADYRRAIIAKCIDALTSERDRRRALGGTPGPAWATAISLLEVMMEDD